MNQAWQDSKALVRTVEMREGDTPGRLAARMVLLASAGFRVTLSDELDPDWCRYLVAWGDTARGGAFWGKADGRRITGWNGQRLAETVVEAWLARPIMGLIPSTRRAA